jgi:hypothetical protein
LQTIFLPRLVIFNSPGRFTAHRCSQPKASRTAAALKVSGNRVWPTWPMDLSRFLSSKAAAAPPVYPAPSHETNEPAAQQATSGACGGRAGGRRKTIRWGERTPGIPVPCSERSDGGRDSVVRCGVLTCLLAAPSHIALRGAVSLRSSACSVGWWLMSGAGLF